MPQTVLTQYGSLRSFTHGLDSNNPFQLFFSKSYDTGQQVIGDVHLDPQLFIILSGEVNFYLDRNSFTGGQGDIFISNFWEPHAFRTKSGKLSLLVVTFSVFALGTTSPFADFDWLLFLKQPVSKRKLVFSADKKQEILNFAGKLIELEETKPYGFQSMQWIIIHEIMFLINSQYISATAPILQKRSEIPILPILQKIRQNPGNDISLSEAAAICTMSRSAFCQTFKAIMNESFAKFIMRSRIGYSCMLLRSQKYTIKEVAEQCGFKNITHFYHVFKKIVKRTPTEFIEKNNDSAGQPPSS